MEIEANSLTSNNIKEVIEYLTEFYKFCKTKISFPTQVSSIENIYKSELLPKLQNELANRFPFLFEWNSLDLESFLEQQILNPLKTKNFYKIKKSIYKDIEAFLCKIDIFSEFESKPMQEFLETEIHENDKILVSIAEELSQKKSYKGKVDFTILNERVQIVYEVLLFYQRLVYFKFEVLDLYNAEFQMIEKDTTNQILNHSRENFPESLKEMEKNLEIVLKERLIEFKEVFVENLASTYNSEPVVNTYIQTYKSSNKYFANLFKDNATNKLGAAPNQVFLSRYLRNIEEQAYDLIIRKHLNQHLTQDSKAFEENFSNDAQNILKNFCFLDNTIFNLFDQKVFLDIANIGRLLSIVILTDYQELNENKYELYLEKLQFIYVNFASADLLQEYPLLKEYISLIDSKNKYFNNRETIKSHLQNEIQIWNETIGKYQNLYAMICLFFALCQSNQSTYSRNYTSNDRYMLKCILRNLNNGASRFTNFQLLCRIEAQVMKYITHNIISNIIVDENSVSLTENIMNQIRNAKIDSYSEHQQHQEQLAQLHNHISQVNKPTKFFLEKISNRDIHSKVITICVSGFTSEDSSKSIEWKGLLPSNAHSEVFALHWNSNTMTNLYMDLLKEIPSIVGLKPGFLLGAYFVQVRPFLVGLATYNAFKHVKNEVWGKTYQEAISTGIYLAHILSKTDLFKDHVINLVGFSLGTLVVMSCILELEKLGRDDLIYDVLLMGGVVNSSDFKKSSLNVVANKITNCYCQTDYILKILLKIVNQNTNPIGLGPILFADKKIENINVTKFIDGHTKYRDNVQEILTQIDFNEDLKYLLS